MRWTIIAVFETGQEAIREIIEFSPLFLTDIQVLI